jgi:acetyltransferase-like isoleucine patch superfamily enzyme
MKRLVEKIIQKRNPNFSFDTYLDSRMLFHLLFSKSWQWLRGKKLLFWFRSSKNMLMGKNVELRHIHKITWGNWVKIDDNVFISALGKGKITIGNNCGIGAYSRIEISTSYNNLGEYIKIGDNVGLGQFACLGGAGGLEIGEECIIGPYLSCHPENHNYESSESIRFQGVSRKGILIGRNCWIGAKVTILDGVEIGENSVIAAGAVVTKSMPPNSIIGGVPAKRIKGTRDNNLQPLKSAV